MPEQPDLLSWKPPQPYAALGETFQSERDGKRLGEQAQRVFKVMRDGKKRGLAQLAAECGDPPASVSARYRDLKRFGFDMRKENVGGGLWVYWMQVPK